MALKIDTLQCSVGVAGSETPRMAVVLPAPAGATASCKRAPRRAHLPTEPVDHPGPLPDQVIAGRRYYRRRLLAGDAPGR